MFDIATEILLNDSIGG